MAILNKLCVRCGKEKPVKGAVFCENGHMVCYADKGSTKTWCDVCKKEMK